MTMAQIITDKILYGSQFAECYSGLYFFNCDTFNEVRAKLASQHIYISDGWSLTEIPTALQQLPDDAYCVIVQFSTDRDYTEHEYRLMRIQKKYIKRFIKNMQDNMTQD